MNELAITKEVDINKLEFSYYSKLAVNLHEWESGASKPGEGIPFIKVLLSKLRIDGELLIQCIDFDSIHKLWQRDEINSKHKKYLRQINEPYTRVDVVTYLRSLYSSYKIVSETSGVLFNITVKRVK